MNKKKKIGRLLLKVSILPVGIVLFVVGDMIVSGSVYRPATYLYRAKSWWDCRSASSLWCSKKQLEKATQNSNLSNQNGTVVTSQNIASKVGLQVLDAGGNAIDAAVAVGYALAVTDPCCGNVGGGGFMLIRFADGKSTFINFREKAPQAASESMFLDNDGEVIADLSTKSYRAVAVPGTVKGLDYALTKYGTMKRSKAMKPAIELAGSGFVLTAGDLQVLNKGVDIFKKEANVAEIFLNNDKGQFKVGDRLVQKKLARTLQQISDNGSDEFYKGSITEKILKSSRENQGILSESDFSSYKVQETTPLECTYRGNTVLTAPPPGGGVTLCQMLSILEGYNLNSLGFHSKDSLHKMFSAMLLAYADRNTLLGDPDFVEIPVNRLLSKEYASKLRSKIPKETAIDPTPLYSGLAPSEGTNTTHYSIMDKYGNSVAVTYTINSYFGAGLMAGDTGFFLNNEMDDFTSKPGVPNSFGLVQGNKNRIEPGKRPLSSMSPTIVIKDNQVVMVTGSPGGSTIPTTILQVLTNVVDFEMSPNKAVNMPRVHYQGLPNWVITEPYALSNEVVQNLWEVGYKVVPFPHWGAAESIFLNSDNEPAIAINDHRKPAGYKSDTSK